MRASFVAAAVLVCVAGCTVTDENPGWSPRQDYPSWAYDAPYYYRPSEDLKVAEVIAGGVPVYYTKDQMFFVRHASGYQLPGVPRLAVWYSLDSGDHWSRAGYFGSEQTHFLFESEQDGPHWVRFVGPDQGVVQSSPGAPHRIYVVDTVGPSITLVLDPPPFEKDEEGKLRRHIYAVGDEVRVDWRVHDPNLDPESIRLATTFAFFPANVAWSEFPARLEPSGSTTAPIPPEAAPRPDQPGGGGMRFRMSARDKAGNLSYVFSPVLQVAATGAQPATMPVRPVVPREIVIQSDGKPGPRPGWPQAGELIRGGASRILLWLPETVKNYKHVSLQFSANNGRSWRTVAEKLQAGKPVIWTVPQVNSKLCLIRVLAEQDRPNGQVQRLMLAQSLLFTVHTVPPEIHMGPKVLPPEPTEQ